MRISDWSSDVCSSDLHLHAAVEATHHGNRGCGGDQRNQQDAGTVAGRRSEEIVETRKSLLSAETERGGEAEQRGEDRQGVEHVSDPAPHGFAQPGIERGAKGPRQIEVGGERSEEGRGGKEGG